MYLIPPISLLSVISNAIIFIVINKTIKETPITKRKLIDKYYKYLKLITIQSLMLAFILLFCFCAFSPRLFKFSFTIIARIYRCRVFVYIGTSLYFFGSILDIIIALERLSIISRKKITFDFISPYKLSLVMFISCFIINLPLWFTFKEISCSIWSILL